MKRIIVFAFTLLLASMLFAETRTIYITRHGQRGDPKYQKKFKNVDEDILMPDGEKQAELLGTYMAFLGFEGTIYVSPYYRTLQTATIAASKMKKCPMILEPRIQENSRVKDASGIVKTTKKCLTKSEIKKCFPEVKIPSKMKFPWRIDNERQAQLDQRLSDVIDEIMENKKNLSGDVFLVCHGGLMPRFTNQMEKRGADFPRRKTYNCCLYAFTYDTETHKVVESKDLTMEYLYDGIVTDNTTYIPISDNK